MPLKRRNTFEQSVKLEISTKNIYFYHLIAKTFFLQFCDSIILSLNVNNELYVTFETRENRK